MNPFADLTPPLQKRQASNLSSHQLASLLEAPLETSAAGVRDRAVLQLLSEGLSLHQIYNLDLMHVDHDVHCLTVSTRDGFCLGKAPTLADYPQAVCHEYRRCISFYALDRWAC